MYDGVKAMISREKELCAAANPKPAEEEKPKVEEKKEEPKAEEKKEEPKAEEPKAEEKKEEERPKPGANIGAGSHLKSPSDITGFVDFPEGTKSLLCKYMTKEVFDKYYGLKDAVGVSFE